MKTETAIKERPIIFTGENVRKILDGTKTQTRRIIKNAHIITADDRIGATEAQCPYGKPGDRLWVRETWRPWWDEEPPNGTGLYCVVQYRDGLIYKPGTSTVTPDIPDENIGHQFAHACDQAPNIAWRSPIHMPRWASRVTLEITDMRVQRVQEIGRDGWKAVNVLAEGITCEEIAHQQRFFHPDDSPAIAFAMSWDRINGKGSWRSNPWVWAITFRVVT